MQFWFGGQVVVGEGWLLVEDVLVQQDFQVVFQCFVGFFSGFQGVQCFQQFVGYVVGVFGVEWVLFEGQQVEQFVDVVGQVCY